MTSPGRKTQRWPLHPAPTPGEALTSWLDRLAALYGMPAAQLLRYNLGPAAALLNDPDADDLDFDPPAPILAALAELTGVELGELRLMTIAGWVPWLADTLDPYDGQDAFHTYVRQDSVLLRPTEAGRNVVPHWLPWLPRQTHQWRATRRLCRMCAAADPDAGLPLLTALPIMLSCGVHGCRLEPELTVWLAAAENELGHGQPVVPAVAALDQLTHQALTTGAVTLPGRPERPVHVGVWLRLLRTLLDEVSTSTSRLTAASTTNLEKIWDTVGSPIRAGLKVWRPYEWLDAPRQEAMLTAAATALDLIRTGRVTARGSLGPLLTAPPHQHVYDGDRPGTTADPWTQFRRDAEVVFEKARTEPRIARELLSLLTHRCRTLADFNRERQFIIINGGIPEVLLPDARELGRLDLL